MEQQLLRPLLLFCRWSWELGSGRVSRGTRCITDVRPGGRPNAPKVTFPCKNLPWYINRSISALETPSSFHSSGQLSKTNCAISDAESSGENRNSLVLPETSISLRFTLSIGMFLQGPILFINVEIWSVVWCLKLVNVLLMCKRSQFNTLKTSLNRATF